MTLRWTIVGSGITARADQLDLQGQLLQRMELKSGGVDGAPVSPGQATLDSASAERMVTEYSYVLPMCGVAAPGARRGPRWRRGCSTRWRPARRCAPPSWR